MTSKKIAAMYQWGEIGTRLSNILKEFQTLPAEEQDTEFFQSLDSLIQHAENREASLTPES